VLSVSPASGVASLTVTADASASVPGSLPIATYIFDFGDGPVVSGTPTSATHTYAAANVYTITVTVSDGQQLLPGTSTASTTVTVVAVPVGPTAALSVSPASGPAPLAVTADAGGSNPGTFPITSYTFAWGDGTTSGPAAGAKQGHAYPNPGSYTVVVTVADDQMPAHTATAQFVVNVGAGVSPNPSLVLTPQQGPSPLTLAADAAGSTAGSAPIAGYTFDFGDGTKVGPQPASSAAHTYPHQGTYLVTLTVVDGSGRSAVMSVQAIVGPVAGTLVHRVSGADRYATAIAVSVARWDATTNTAPTSRHPHSVVVARGDSFADALAGIPLAAKERAPLLLSEPAELRDDLDSEVRRILPRGSTVFILGGTEALSRRVEARLKADGYQIVRLAGGDRYETSLQIAKVGLGDPQHVVVATGTDFPDALAAGPFAANGFALNGEPAAVVLSAGAFLPPAVADYVKSKTPGSTNASPRIIGIGGPGAYAIAANIPTTQFDALVGSDRFDTAAKLAPYFPPTSVFGVANGDTFPDALTGGAAQALAGGPVLLVGPDFVPGPTAEMLATVRSRPAAMDVFGGPAAVSEGTLAGLASAVGGRIG
jgi:PKD repeat protein